MRRLDMSDDEREAEIERLGQRARNLWHGGKHRAAQSLYDKQARLIRERSPERVREMEQEQGLQRS